MASRSPQLLIATTNAGKLGEIRDVLSPLSTASRHEGPHHRRITPGEIREVPSSSSGAEEAAVEQANNSGNSAQTRDDVSPRSVGDDAAVEQAFRPAMLPITLLSLRDLPPIEEPEETGATYAENARLKALYYAARSGLMTVAEDSGLMIDALDGEPGLLSARFANGRFDLAFEEIFRRLDAKGVHESSARFICALALVDDGRVIFEAEGIVDGVVGPPPRGDGGFGYDPIFYYPPLGRTMAELPASVKHRVSHRGRAFAALREFLAKDPL